MEITETKLAFCAVNEYLKEGLRRNCEGERKKSLFDGGTAGDVLDGRVRGSLLFPTEELDVQRCHTHALDGWMAKIETGLYRS